MSNKLTAIKIKLPNGTYSEQILISVLAQNVKYDNTRNLNDILNLLDHRIDQIVAPTSSTLTLDEEVRDIREGYDGTSYSGAGVAVRTQITNLANSMVEVDNTLTTSGAAADAKKTGDEIADLRSAVNSFEGISDAVKYAILNCFRHVAWADTGGISYYSSLAEAFEINQQISDGRFVNNVAIIQSSDLANGSFTGEPPYHNTRTDRVMYTGFDIPFNSGYKYTITVTSSNNANLQLAIRPNKHASTFDTDGKISAGDTGWFGNNVVFNRKNEESVYGWTSLFILVKKAGDANIAASDIQEIRIVRSPAEQNTYLANIDFTNSLIDKAGNYQVSLTSADGYDLPERLNDGVHITQGTQAIRILSSVNNTSSIIGKTIELDISYFNFTGNTSAHSRILMFSNDGRGSFIYNKSKSYNAYSYSGSSGSESKWSSTPWTSQSSHGGYWNTDAKINAISGKIIKLVFVSQRTMKLYVQGSYAGYINDLYIDRETLEYFSIGGASYSVNNGDQIQNMVVSGFRIYENA